MRSDDVLLRPATKQDVPTVVQVWIELMDFHSEEDPHFTRCPDACERMAEYLDSQLGKDDACVFVAELAGRIIGYCMGCITKHPPVIAAPDYGFITDLCVSANCRRHHIGERLYHQARDWFASRSIHRLELRVATCNNVSTAFWAKMGFTPHMETRYRDI